MTTLENNLLPASSVWNTERFFGWKVSSVSVSGQDGKKYLLVKPHRGFAWNFQVVEGDSKDGPVVLHITKGGCGTTVTIKNPKTEEVIEMKAPSFWRRIRVFTWRGQEYVWKRSSKMFAKDVTYSLTPADNPSLALAENTWTSGFFLKGTGRITVFETGSHLPAELVIAMGLTMEQLWYDARNGSASAGGGGAAAGSY